MNTHNVQMMWESWNAATYHQYCSTIVAVLFAGILRRALVFVGKVRQERLLLARAAPAPSDDANALLGSESTNSNGNGHKGDASTSAKRLPIFSPRPALLPQSFELTAYHALSYTLSYLLMLAAMTYNSGVFVSVIVGEAVGYFIFETPLLFRHPAAPNLDASAACH